MHQGPDGVGVLVGRDEVSTIIIPAWRTAEEISQRILLVGTQPNGPPRGKNTHLLTLSCPSDTHFRHKPSATCKPATV